MSKILVYPPRVIIVGIPGLRGIRGPAGSGGSGGSGGQIWTRHLVTAAGSFTLDPAQWNWLDMDCTSGNQTVLLPDLADVQGLSFRIKRIAVGNNLITIQGVSGQTIDGDANWILYDKKELLEVTAVTSTEWRIS